MRAVIAVVRAQYRLDWNGIHGQAHWERVRDNVLRLAEQTGARKMALWKASKHSGTSVCRSSPAFLEHTPHRP